MSCHPRPKALNKKGRDCGPPALCKYKLFRLGTPTNMFLDVRGSNPTGAELGAAIGLLFLVFGGLTDMLLDVGRGNPSGAKLRARLNLFLLLGGIEIPLGT